MLFDTINLKAGKLFFFLKSKFLHNFIKQIKPNETKHNNIKYLHVWLTLLVFKIWCKIPENFYKWFK